jgi:hypothetical protein
MNNAKLLKKLLAAREPLNVLYNMLKAEKVRIEQKTALAEQAKISVDDAIFDLTGDEFYKTKS